MLRYIISLKKPNIIIRPYLFSKRLLFSDLLVFGPEYIILVVMNILKTLQRLEAATEKCSG